VSWAQENILRHSDRLDKVEDRYYQLHMVHKRILDAGMKVLGEKEALERECAELKELMGTIT